MTAIAAFGRRFSLFGRRYGRRYVLPIAAGVALVVALAVVFPTSSLLKQRSSLADTRERLDVLQDTNTQLEDQIARLQTNEEIERQARESYGLVYPGDEAYGILPPTPEALDLTALRVVVDAAVVG